MNLKGWVHNKYDYSKVCMWGTKEEIEKIFVWTVLVNKWRHKIRGYFYL